MTWWQYVSTVGGGASQAAIARRAHLSPATVSRWQSGEPHPRNVAAFAIAYGRPVLEAFVAAGFLTEDDARAQVVRIDRAALTDDELVDELRDRLARARIDTRTLATDPEVIAMREAGMSDEAIAAAVRGRDAARGSGGAPSSGRRAEHHRASTA